MRSLDAFVDVSLKRTEQIFELPVIWPIDAHVTSFQWDDWKEGCWYHIVGLLFTVRLDFLPLTTQSVMTPTMHKHWCPFKT